jgi:hypothetical protein
MNRIPATSLRLRLLFSVSILSLGFLVLTACGNDSGGASGGDLAIGALVSEEGKTYSFEEFTAIGFKKGKEYDVSELPGAESAFYGFWGLDPYNREDFELRFYASHADAVAMGTDLAIERTGENARLTDDTATWTEGVKDARECHGVLGQAQHAASCTEAKYYDFMILDNLILFCPGDAIDVARKNCNELLAQLIK